MDRLSILTDPDDRRRPDRRLSSSSPLSLGLYGWGPIILSARWASASAGPQPTRSPRMTKRNDPNWDHTRVRADRRGAPAPSEQEV